jgi:hypothetical protein
MLTGIVCLLVYFTFIVALRSSLHNGQHNQQTQLFIISLYDLGQHVSARISSSSGPF